ncbi:RHS repeat-associated core domain-containing protein [Segatella oulorum]|uniref:RHS repeat-associated core domain-containing protein n=2 Tax=Segatella oulorum TaxID=28136 RepID=A0A1T4PW62_9BACT|nr:RHS repeat-associated core domain-containing protein [Segatella oulorum]
MKKSLSQIQNNKATLGGSTYDAQNCLIHANGKAKTASYRLDMTYGIMSEPLTKVQKVDSTKTAQSYDFMYKYEDSNHPTAPTQIGHEHYTYDANGNPTLVENDSLGTERRMYWDEDNRLMVLSDNGKTSRYTYNAAGERIIKSHGDLEGVYINGAPQGITFHETEDYTIYPAPMITVTKNRFTKHYFIGDKRIASKIGTGKFSNVYGISGNNVTAGQKDYAARMMQIEKQREEYYKSLGTPPGVPTMKGATADPDNTGRGYNDIIGDLGDHSVPEGWVQHPKRNTTPGTPPGPPIQWGAPEDPDNAQPGYGYIPTDTTNIEDIFFYHSDHLGSTSYITDAKANITQFDAYLPYGELLVDEYSSSEDMPYKFNGKELDEETGLYYYGARYMDPKISMWLGVDPLMEKYTNVSGYVYCHSNPIVRIDRDGRADYFSISGKFIRLDKSKDKNIYIRTSSSNVLLSKYNFKKNLRAMMRITYHYAKEVGLEGKAKSIGVKSMKSNPEGELAITIYDNRIRVSTVNGHFNKSMNQIYNFRSTLAHEGFHIDTPNGVDEEVLVIMKEMGRKEFGKTTRSFKDNTAGYLQKELEKLYAVSDRKFYNVIGKAQKILNKYGAKSSYEFIEGGNKIHF